MGVQPGYIDVLKEVIFNKIIKTGRLSGVSKETIFKGLDKTSAFIFDVFKQYRSLHGDIFYFFFIKRT